MIKFSIAIVLENRFDPNAGGVQRSTSKMAQLFKNKGHEVVIISMRGEGILSTEPNAISVVNCPKINKQEFLSELFILKDINVIINQSGFVIELNTLLKKSSPPKAVFIATLRFNPLSFVDNYETTIKQYFVGKGLRLFYNSGTKLLILRYHLYRQNYWYKRILKEVDFMVVLSNSYINEIYQLSPGSKVYSDKIRAIPNLFPQPTFKYNFEKKENVILYVGRLNIIEKRVDLLLNIWLRLHGELSNWEFWVVGYGPEEDGMKRFCNENSLSRVKFFGKQDPDLFYEKAKILHFTSASEGFPNVLVEAQRFGLVPVLFNSYSAAIDIVQDGNNGFLVEPFCIDSFIDKTKVIIDNAELQMRMSINALESSKRYSFETVYGEWFNLFQEKC